MYDYALEIVIFLSNLLRPRCGYPQRNCYGGAQVGQRELLTLLGASVRVRVFEVDVDIEEIDVFVVEVGVGVTVEVGARRHW